MNLQDKVIAITGAGQGLGRAMSVFLAEKGARIAVIDLNQEQMDETKRLIEEVGGSAETFVCNVADEAQVESTFTSIPVKLGPLFGLVNNAGILRDGLMVRQKDGEISKLSLSHWQAVIDVNLTGVFLCGREAAVQMIKGGEGGCIINISSISRAGNMGQSNYSAAKAGVASLATVWAKELSRYNIRANAIAPGFIETDMTGSMPPQVLDKIISGIPLKRMGQPENIAHTVAYLMENDYVSGRVVEVDGALRI
ncbi:MAG: 3-oxoacyl-ACP reductase [Oceanospirillaceae bacterium]|nr:3-oxoacyl-ACP reductase [Oceanospirillaceae bacterium]|tara:strand:- start:775 stop:1533 length:759 start_codon:yes stop_codon:yes gene_type:complete